MQPKNYVIFVAGCCSAGRALEFCEKAVGPLKTERRPCPAHDEAFRPADGAGGRVGFVPTVPAVGRQNEPILRFLLRERLAPAALVPRHRHPAAHLVQDRLPDRTRRAAGQAGTAGTAGGHAIAAQPQAAEAVSRPESNRQNPGGDEVRQAVPEEGPVLLEQDSLPGGEAADLHHERREQRDPHGFRLTAAAVAEQEGLAADLSGDQRAARAGREAAAEAAVGLGAPARQAAVPGAAADERGAEF